MVKTKFQKIILSTIIVVILFFGFTTAYAINDYTIIAPLPGISGPTKLGDYLPAAFNLSIGIAAALAFIVITWGGITYATSDAISGKEQGKEWITNAIYGLLLVIGAWIILSTINPQILRLDLILRNPSVKPAEGSLVIDGTPLNQEQLAADKLVRDELWNSSINKPIKANGNPCKDGQTTGCTNLNGLHRSAIDGLISLNSICGPLCTLTITGGTEGGHETHGVGEAIVDLRRDRAISDWIQRNQTGVNSTSKGLLYTVNVAGRPVKFLDETGGVPHWHVVFQ